MVLPGRASIQRNGETSESLQEAEGSRSSNSKDEAVLQVLRISDIDNTLYLGVFSPLAAFCSFQLLLAASEDTASQAGGNYLPVLLQLLPAR